MNQRRIFSVLMFAVMVFSLISGGSIPAAAQTPQPPPPGGENLKQQPPRITQADRQAAADRSAATGFETPLVGEADMQMPDSAPRYFSVPNYANSPLPGNIVIQWNAIAQEVVQPMPMPGMPMMMGGTSMATAFVYLSYVQAAVYNALLAVEGGYTPYDGTPAPIKYFLPVIVGNTSEGTAGAPVSSSPFIKPAYATDPTASREAAVATAAFKVLIHYFPDDLTLPAKYADSLASIPDGPAKTAGIAIGDQAAAAIIALRTGDGLLAPDTYTLPDPSIPGNWQPTVLPDSTVVPPIDPWMAKLKPFTFETPDQFRSVVGTPWALDSAEWATQMNAVKPYSAASAIRTPDQTSTALFWTTNNVIQFNSAYRDVANTRGMNLLDTARLMAMGNMIGTDALVSCFDTKYSYSFWRPVAAIRRAAEDNNDLTVADPMWMPLVMTPSFPEYVAGHSCYVAAQGEVFKAALGTDQIQLDLSSLVTGQTRRYTTAAEMRAEVNNARVWAGLHYPASTTLGENLGLTVAKNALLRFFNIDPINDTEQHNILSGGIRKFVDTLPGLGEAGANNLGQYIPVAVPDTTTYLGSDYYEIAVVQYEERMHSDLPPTLLRGYVQLSTTLVPGQQVPLTNVLLDGTVVPLTGYSGVTPPHYLGPTIVANKDRPVRILFRNLLPSGVDGNLFIPVDVTVMGAGMGPLADPNILEPDPLNPMCGMDPKPAECFVENRATLHLHGGISPWISDGTPHQWITPADEVTPYPQGVSVSPVPDMGDTGDPTDGAMTFYYTNQQSARLMFYHDHAWGITRLNVYAGEAAGYIITDPTEQALISQNLIPDAASTIPLILQDKTFVPSQAQLAVSDPLWDNSRWGSYGDLWLPHVYVPAQNPGDSSGVNQFGRWAYGPWFWPPTSNIPYPPVPNPYYDPECDTDIQWCEPPMMPGTPYVSMGMEAFNDTPVVNGTAYPTITIEPKTYRLRILNAASDRFFNLSFYMAVDANGKPCDLSINPTPAAEASGVACTEVALNPAEVLGALDDPAGIFPTPVAGTEGPSWVQIGTEGGFLPAPTVIPAQFTTWVVDPTVFNAGNVDKHSLLLGPAERADTIVDFSAFAGKTLILYNDAPAAFPARDPRYDYYTGNPDLRDTGGAPSTLPGYGPNIRTMMQIKVAAAAPAAEFDLAALETAFKAVSLGGLGVFENGQHPIIVGQGAYNSAYGTNFRNTGLLDGFARITDFSLTFRTLAGWETNQTLTLPFQSKAIQDEMGEAFDHEYGRMSGNLGLEVPLTQAGVGQNLILYPFVNPASELIDASNLPSTTSVTPIAVANDGTQIWKITHNGVDTHPIHFHLFDVQLLNRVGWDGIVRPPEPNELGWKDTLRISPLEDTIVAIRPIIPVVPFDLPNSIRPLNPMMPLGTTLSFNSTDALANPTAPIVNSLVNFGAEYVWHCHILSHEEMDMMRPISVALPPRAPSALAGVVQGTGAAQEVVLSWTDNSANETGFIVQRALAETGPWTDLITVAANTTTYTDLVGDTTVYYYQVVAINQVGYSGVPGYATLTAKSISNIFTVDSIPPAAPTVLTATLEVGPQVLLMWGDNATDELGFAIERADNGGAFTLLTTAAANAVSYTDTTVVPGSSYEYRVAAVKSLVASAFSNTAAVSVPLPPADPSAVTATLEAGPQILLGWTDNAANETGFVIERAVNGGAFAPLIAVAANAVSYTDTTVVSGSSYAYRVAAVNESGSSAWVEAAPSPIAVP